MLWVCMRKITGSREGPKCCGFACVKLLVAGKDLNVAGLRRNYMHPM